MMNITIFLFAKRKEKLAEQSWWFSIAMKKKLYNSRWYFAWKRDYCAQNAHSHVVKKEKHIEWWTSDKSVASSAVRGQSVFLDDETSRYRKIDQNERSFLTLGIFIAFASSRTVQLNVSKKMYSLRFVLPKVRDKSLLRYFLRVT